MNNELAGNIRRFRKERGLTQEKLAEELDKMNGVAEEVPLNADETVNPNSVDAIQAQANEDDGSGTASKQGEWAICPVCGKRFQKKSPDQKYSSIACANKARKNQGITFGR